MAEDVYLKNALVHIRDKTKIVTSPDVWGHESFPEIIPELFNIMIPMYANTEYKRMEKTMKYSPVRITAQWYAAFSSSSSGAGHVSGIGLLHNLMNALPRKIKRIRDLAERHSLAAKRQNFRISVVVSRRPWLQRTPLPTRDPIQDLPLFCRKISVLCTLPDVPDPCSDPDLLAVNNLYVNCRDSGVSFALHELPDGFCIDAESGVVIHGRHYISSDLLMRDYLVHN